MCWAHQVLIFGKLLSIFLGMAKSRHYKVSNINGEKSNIDKNIRHFYFLQYKGSEIKTGVNDIKI